jgi:hypothetical protein
LCQSCTISRNLKGEPEVIFKTSEQWGWVTRDNKLDAGGSSLLYLSVRIFFTSIFFFAQLLRVQEKDVLCFLFTRRCKLHGTNPRGKARMASPNQEQKGTTKNN